MNLLHAAASRHLGADVTVEPLYRGALPDSMEIFHVRAGPASPPVALMVSPVAAPFAAEEAARRARAAAQVLGPSLARRVPLPLATGEVAGRSYAMLPLLQPLARSRVGWWTQRARVLPVVLAWLHDVLVQTAQPVPTGARTEKYFRPLQAMADAADAGAEIRDAAAQALDRLQRHRWEPCTSLMHGDLWLGNLMMREAIPGATRLADRLAIIDWAGARIDGYPLFDLLRTADSLHLRARRLRQELLRHCGMLQCELHDCRGYALAAAGAIALQPGHFARAPFLRMVHDVDRVLRAALEA